MSLDGYKVVLIGWFDIDTGNFEPFQEGPFTSFDNWVEVFGFVRKTDEEHAAEEQEEIDLYNEVMQGEY